MIDNIIDVARLEADRFEIHPEQIDLVDLVNAVESIAKPIASDKRIDLVTEVEENVPLIKSDWDALSKIVMNLMSNALKFTGEGGRVSVKVCWDEASQSVIMRVQDDGVGIAEADISTIFERFVQADSSIHREHGGSGLGLSLVKELAEMLGGTVCVVSGKDEGSLFTVTLPQKKEGSEQ